MVWSLDEKHGFGFLMMESIQASAVVQVRSHVDIATRSMYDVVYDRVHGSEALIFLKP